MEDISSAYELHHGQKFIIRGLLSSRLLHSVGVPNFELPFDALRFNIFRLGFMLLY